jgi:hypothetical protein
LIEDIGKRAPLLRGNLIGGDHRDGTTDVSGRRRVAHREDDDPGNLAGGANG